MRYNYDDKLRLRQEFPWLLDVIQDVNKGSSKHKHFTEEDIAAIWTSC